MITTQINLISLSQTRAENSEKRTAKSKKIQKL